jgi:hypothetical protein
VADSCEHGNGALSSANCWEFLSSCTTGGILRKSRVDGVSWRTELEPRMKRIPTTRDISQLSEITG